MAEQAQQPRRRGKKEGDDEKEKTPKLVEYVVLRLLEVKLTPDLRAIFPAVNEEDDQLDMRSALAQGVWVPVMKDGKPRRIAAPSQERAIEIVTGKAEEAKQGTWRAVSWSAWKGATTVEPPRQVMLDVRAVTEEE